MAKPHHQLAVWQRSINLVKGIYLSTREFPDTEKFGLISQMRGAAVSIPSNIAEGDARNSRKEFINFLHITQESIAELETQILISQELAFAKLDSINSLLQEMDEISKMIIGLQRSLRTAT
jgi:four helix bundle protein